MLKKLVKFGNSNALVLDRTILALLNLDEGGVVKLRIEGDTLVVRAQSELKPTESMRLEMENLTRGSETLQPITDNVHETMRNFCKEIEKNPEATKKLKEWLPGSENDKKLQSVFKEIRERYQDVMQQLATKAFQNDLKKLNKKHQGKTTSKSYIDDFSTLRLQHSPRAAEMDQELKQAALNLGIPQEFILKTGV